MESNDCVSTVDPLLHLASAYLRHDARAQRTTLNEHSCSRIQSAPRHLKDTTRVFPFDLIPRIITSKQWASTESGFSQRARALNVFLDDVYGKQRILKERVIPEKLALGSTGRSLRSKCCIHRLRPPFLDVSPAAPSRRYACHKRLNCRSVTPSARAASCSGLEGSHPACAACYCL